MYLVFALGLEDSAHSLAIRLNLHASNELKKKKKKRWGHGNCQAK